MHAIAHFLICHPRSPDDDDGGLFSTLDRFARISVLTQQKPIALFCLILVLTDETPKKANPTVRATHTHPERPNTNNHGWSSKLHDCKFNSSFVPASIINLGPITRRVSMRRFFPCVLHTIRFPEF